MRGIILEKHDTTQREYTRESRCQSSLSPLQMVRGLAWVVTVAAAIARESCSTPLPSCLSRKMRKE